MENPMTTFFPNNIENLIQDDYFRNLFTLDPMLVSTGVYYGFPSCCIEHFCDNKNKNTLDYEDHPMNGTGYLPCPHCIERTKDLETFSEYINENRYCTQPFPSKQTEIIDENLDKFFAYLCYQLYQNPLKELKAYSKLSYLINEIDESNPIYLYIKGFKINVSSISITDKKQFLYMISNNQFCSTQLACIFEWQNKQEAKNGIKFPASELMQHIHNEEFNLIYKHKIDNPVYKSESITNLNEQLNILENNPLSKIKQIKNNHSHFN